LERAVLVFKDAMRSYLLTLGPGIMVGWLVTLSLLLVGHLGALQVREIRRNRRMDKERERLGLKRGHRRASYPPFGPKFFPTRRADLDNGNNGTAPSQTWTLAPASAGYRKVASLLTGTVSISEANTQFANSYQSYRVTLLPETRSHSPAQSA
jgi:hypothetical protein